jgi:hypothetical protein
LQVCQTTRRRRTPGSRRRPCSRGPCPRARTRPSGARGRAGGRPRGTSCTPRLHGRRLGSAAAAGAPRTSRRGPAWESLSAARLQSSSRAASSDRSRATGSRRRPPRASTRGAGGTGSPGSDAALFARPSISRYALQPRPLVVAHVHADLRAAEVVEKKPIALIRQPAVALADRFAMSFATFTSSVSSSR